MKALVWYGKDDLRYEDRDIPQIAHDEILMKIAYAGICGAEMHIFEGRVDPATLHTAPPPAVLGHEFSGTVAKIGKEVSGYREGDPITAHPWGSCGECYFCNQAQEHFCTNAFNVMTNPRAGAYAEYTAVRAKRVYRLPPDMSLKIAALTEPISIALHAIDLANVRPGYTVAVLGGGTIGLCCLQVAQRAGASLTIVSDPVESRLKVARELGADIVVNPTKGSLKEVLMQATDNLGVDSCIEAAGVKTTCTEAVSLTKNCGTAVIVGATLDMNVDVDFFEMCGREITLRGSHWSPYSFTRAISLMKTMDLDRLVTHVFGFSEIQKALEVQRSQSGIKILLRPGDGLS